MICSTARETIFVGTGDPIEEIDKAEFRLLYEGELLPSAGTNKRTAEKHTICRSFHPQLRRLWNISPNLRSMAAKLWVDSLPTEEAYTTLIDLTRTDFKVSEEHFESAIKSTGQNWSRGGFNFVPLVTENLALRCSIDIVLLRPEESRLIFEAGDIDGQLKTVFDALRMPKDARETRGARPQEDEDPFFCLLEDDRIYPR